MTEFELEKREEAIDTVGGFAGQVLSFGTGMLITDVITTILPPPVKVGTKLVRVLGAVGIELILQDKCEEIAKKKVKEALEVVDAVKGLNKLSKEQKQKKKELKQIKKKYDKESKKLKKQMRKDLDDAVDATDEVIHKVHKMCVAAVENAN